MGLKVLVGNEDKVIEQLKEDIVCGVLQYPGTLGDIKDPSEAISKIHKKNGKAILVCDLLALSMLKTPRELGADIAVGSSQRFGIPMGYGGPHAAFFATKDEYKRSMPGRIVGVSVDRHGFISMSIYRNSNNSSWHGSLKFIFSRKKCCVWTSIT